MKKHLDGISKTKNFQFNTLDSFMALIKCYTGNAAYEDMKTVMRQSRFHNLKNYLYLLFKGVEDFGF